MAQALNMVNAALQRQVGIAPRPNDFSSKYTGFLLQTAPSAFHVAFTRPRRSETLQYRTGRLMKTIARKLSVSVASIGLLLAGPACAQQEAPPAPVANASAPAEEVELSGPALWKLADEDTTIYLFGTVHALPDNVDWFKGSIADALAQSESVVTEILVDDDLPNKMQALVLEKGMLPPGTNLRSLLDDEQREAYDAAMVKLGMQPTSFAPFEPWYAGMMLSMIPLLQQGYSPDQGVEKVLLDKADGKARLALETVDQQIGVFDGLPEETQVNFLIDTAKNVDQIKPMLDAMVAEWLEGDAEELAKLMNDGMNDELLAEALLYRRNQAWAVWLSERLDEPGTVFVAVGAGHLAGKQSVQEWLEADGLEVMRVQ
jgi:uncharacterized protein YbaP (TraB family)